MAGRMMAAYGGISALEAGYRVICPDLLGYGSKVTPTEVERYQLSALVSDTALLDQLGLEKYTVSRDYGAVLGWELAAHTERLHLYNHVIGHLAEFLKYPLITCVFSGSIFEHSWWLLNIGQTTVTFSAGSSHPSQPRFYR